MGWDLLECFGEVCVVRRVLEIGVCFVDESE